jgi:hypothetical protein
MMVLCVTVSINRMGIVSFFTRKKAKQLMSSQMLMTAIHEKALTTDEAFLIVLTDIRDVLIDISKKRR